MTRTPARHVAAWLAALALLLGPAAPAAAGGGTPELVFTIMGDGGWIIGQGTAAYVPPAYTEIQVYKDRAGAVGRDDVVVTAVFPGGRWANFSIIAPSSHPRLSVGQYTTSRAEPPPDWARFDLGYHGRGCNWAYGTVDVLEVERGADGLIDGLAFDYTLLCEAHTYPDPRVPPTHGSVRLNSDVPHRYTWMGQFHTETYEGRTARGTLTLTNEGTAPQTYGPSTWEPADIGTEQAPLTIDRDGCAGVRLQPGGRCDIEVSALSDGTHHVAGHVRTPDETRRGAAHSPVRMTALPTPGKTTLTATPVRGGVRLSSGEDHRSHRVLRSDAAGGPQVVVARDVDLPWTDTTAAPGSRYTYTVRAAVTGGEGPVSNAVTAGPLPVPDGGEGLYVPIEPVRVVDTRSGHGAPRGPVGPAATIRFDPAEAGGIVGVSAVVLNVTGVGPTSNTHLRVWPAGQARPQTSSLNLRPGQDRANQVVVPVGPDGQVELDNDTGSTHVVVDLQGFYTTADGPRGGGYHTAAPRRVWDSRVDGHRLAPGEVRSIRVDVPEMDMVGQPAREHITAAAVNVTVVSATSVGNITAWDGRGDVPTASNVNFAPGVTVANHAIVPVRHHGDRTTTISLRNDSPGPTTVLVDVHGWYDDGTDPAALRYRPVPTTRVADTRAGRGAVAAGDALRIPGGALPDGSAQVVNVTATGSGGGGHLTAWSGRGLLPPTSTLNYVAGEDSPGMAAVSVADDGGVAFTVGTSSTHVVVDHLGFFY